LEELAVNLREVTPGGRPKGYSAYRPRGGNVVTATRILDIYAEMEACDALPLGPRQTGYRLKERFPGEYTKTDFKTIEQIVKRLQQAGKLPWAWVADASRVDLDPGGWDDTADYLAGLPPYFRDLRKGQPVVVEIYAETRETLPLIARVAHERGVRVYSGGGSAGPGLAIKVAARAVVRSRERGQATHLFGIADFDVAGIENVLRPHIEHISAFLYGTDSRSDAVITGGDDTTVSFEHLALTPEQALDLTETDEDRDRVREYLDSGSNLWDRDLRWLADAQKIETEALDPVRLRDLVVAVIESVIDTKVLDEIRAVGESEAARLKLSIQRLRTEAGGL
jgi:hypothetical protein